MANESSSEGGAVASDSAIPKPQERVAASVRREQILAAASRAFGERGYYGATTDLVAKAAGISQPYVVRMFGTKENLFVEVLDRALGKLLVAFHAALDEAASKQETHDEMKTRLGAAYADLIGDRGILLSLMQAFITGHEPVIGERARSGFLEIYQLLRDKGDMDPDEVVEFLAHGMLFNTLIAMRLVDQLDADDPCVPELLKHTFRTKLDIVVNTVTKNDTTSAADARKTA